MVLSKFIFILYSVWYNTCMKKRKIVILSVGIIIVALLLEASVLKYVNDKNAYQTSKVLVDRVITVNLSNH